MTSAYIIAGLLFLKVLLLRNALLLSSAFHASQSDSLAINDKTNRDGRLASRSQSRDDRPRRQRNQIMAEEDYLNLLLKKNELLPN